MAKKPSAYTNFVANISMSVDRNHLSYSEWIPQNFTHPKNNLKPWSWKDHEFQIEIFDNGHDVKSVSTVKPAQVGLTEGSLRWAVSFCAMNDFRKLAYTLPTATFSSSVAATRLQPAIDNSPLIASMVSSDTDNVKYKKIGSCFLFMLGTSGERSGISVDLDCLVTDEKNFCNQNVLQTMNSRLLHSDLKLYRNLSTPTLDNFGITADYNAGSQAVRLCKCDRCNSWQELTMESIEIPGYINSIADFNIGDANHPGVADSYLKCMSCKGVLTLENLNNPDKRKWVHKNTAKFKEGIKSYKVVPWDVPTINTVPSVLADIKRYGKEKWTQFRMGEAYDSADNSFLQSAMQSYSLPAKDCWNLDAIWGGFYRSSRRVFIGTDLGKTYNWLTLGIENDQGGLSIVGFYRITQEMIKAKCDGEVNFGRYVERLSNCLELGKVVTDHSPNYEVALYLTSKLGNKAWGAYYKSDISSGRPDIYKFNENNGTVIISVDLNFTELCGMVNSGVVRIPERSWGDASYLWDHLSVTKKQVMENSKGQQVEKWVSVKLDGAETTEDHGAHSLGYCYTAFASTERRDSGVVLIPDMGGLIRLVGQGMGGEGHGGESRDGMGSFGLEGYEGFNKQEKELFMRLMGGRDRDRDRYMF